MIPRTPSRPHLSSLNFLPIQPPESGIYNKTKFNRGGKEHPSFIMDVEGWMSKQQSSMTSLCCTQTLGIKMSGLSSLCWKQSRRDLFLKFPSQGATNASVCGWCGCDRCNDTWRDTFMCQPISCGSVDTAVFGKGWLPEWKMKLRREKSGFMYECCAVDSQQTVKNAKIRFLIVANCF